MKLSASLEDYLETIYNVIRVKGGVRATDIARQRKVANSSVTTALHNLVNRGLVNHAPYDIVTLTPEGEDVARGIVRKHTIFRDFFITVLSIDSATADSCACGIEHIIPDEVVNRFVEYLEFEKNCEYRGRKWVEGRGFVCGREDDNDGPDGGFQEHVPEEGP